MFLFTCKYCRDCTYGKEENKQWQQPTHTQSDSEPSNSHGTTTGEELAQLINVLRSTVAGISCDLLTNFPKNIGTVNTDKLWLLHASIVELNRELQDFTTIVNLVDTYRKTPSISMFGNQH